MRRPVTLVVVASVAAAAAGSACAKSANNSADSTAAQPTTPAAAAAVRPTPIRLADVAGTWTMTGKNPANDSALVTYQLVATADTAGWRQRAAGRRDIPVRVTSVAGDSIVLDVGPYESMLRKGVQVTTHSVNRLEAGKLVGTLVAHYRTATSDSVLNVKTEGVRTP